MDKGLRFAISDALLLLFWVTICCLDSAVQWDLESTTPGGWYSLLKNGCLLGAFVWSWHFVFGRKIRFAYAAWTVWMCLVLALEWFVRLNFNMVVSGDLWLFIAGSSRDEARDFALQFLTGKTVSLVVLAAVLAFAGVRFLLKARYGAPSWGRAVACVLTLVAVGALGDVAFLNPRSWDQFLNGLICKAIVPDVLANRVKWQELARAKASPRIPDGLVSGIRQGLEPLGVVVIGESATRNHLHLYGYPRETTPWADAAKDELVCLTNVVASAPHTQQALMEVFTDATRENGGRVSHLLTQVLKKFGYASALVSNQGHWGRGSADSYLATIFGVADRSVYLEEETDAWPKYDAMLLPYVRQCVDSFPANGASALFVHLMGSHWHFRHRCPPDEARWPVDCRDDLTRDLSPGQRKLVNQYDSSIAYTDGILSNVVCAVRRTGRPSFVLYFSDHGETTASSAFRNRADRDLWEIPFFVWFSPEYAAAYPDTVERLRAVVGKPLRSDQLTHWILWLFQIRETKGTSG